MHLLEDKKKHPAAYIFLGSPKAWKLSGCFFYLQVNAPICVDHTKSPCVAKQRVATVRGACCVLELLRARASVPWSWQSRWRPEAFEAKLVPNVAFWRQEKLLKRRPVNGQSTAQGGLRRTGCCPPKGCKIRWERGAFEAKLVPNLALWRQEKLLRRVACKERDVAHQKVAKSAGKWAK